MVSMLRVVTRWSGFNGAPGFTNLFFRNIGGESGGGSLADAAAAEACHDKVHDFWTACRTFLPNDVTLNVDPTVDELNDTNGQLEDSYSVPPLAPIIGTQAGAFSAASGGVIGWTTGAIRNGRRIRGRTFLVPLAGISFGLDGRIDPGVVTSIQAAATAMAAPTAGSTLGVWARPTAPGATDGVWAPVSGARTTNLPAILRSRRD
jgi:hypothetical protein